MRIYKNQFMKPNNSRYFSSKMCLYYHGKTLSGNIVWRNAGRNYQVYKILTSKPYTIKTVLRITRTYIVLLWKRSPLHWFIFRFKTYQNKKCSIGTITKRLLKTVHLFCEGKYSHGYFGNFITSECGREFMVTFVVSKRRNKTVFYYF